MTTKIFIPSMILMSLIGFAIGFAINKETINTEIKRVEVTKDKIVEVERATPPEGWVEYRDSQDRFSFFHPEGHIIRQEDSKKEYKHVDTVWEEDHSYIHISAELPDIEGEYFSHMTIEVENSVVTFRGWEGGPVDRDIANSFRLLK